MPLITSWLRCWIDDTSRHRAVKLTTTITITKERVAHKRSVSLEVKTKREVVTTMPFCTSCGRNLSDDAMFCSNCGALVSGSSQGTDLSPSSNFLGDLNLVPVILRYKKNPLMFLLSNLSVMVDGNLNFVVPSNGQIQISLPPGQHLYEAYVTYIGKYGKIKKTVLVSGKSTIITYTPPIAMFMEGTITVVHR